jgi:hypothetical protein
MAPFHFDVKCRIRRASYNFTPHFYYIFLNVAIARDIEKGDQQTARKSRKCDKELATTD